jgi:hypothetical protein
VIDLNPDKYIGQYHENELHGAAKEELADGNSYWGQYNHS